MSSSTSPSNRKDEEAISSELGSSGNSRSREESAGDDVPPYSPGRCSINTDVSRQPREEDNKPVTWMSLPRKCQIAILSIARLADPISERSLMAYVYYQLQWFDPSLSAADIAYQMGILTSAFAAAQCVTAVMWGRAADTVRVGRKGALLIGLCGSCIAATGVAFSRTFMVMLFFRSLSGALNGNVGVLRTMVSEIVAEKKYQSRAFLLLPICFNVGAIIGPIWGGFLAPSSDTPAKQAWINGFPYAPPNLANAFFLLTAALVVLFGLKETHPLLQNRTDWGRRLSASIKNQFWGSQPHRGQYSQLPTNEGIELPETRDPEHGNLSDHEPNQKPDLPPKPSLRSMLTRNIVLVLSQLWLQALHTSTYNTLLILLLSSPVVTRSSSSSSSSSSTNHPSSSSPLLFTGGLGLTPHAVGLATASIGIIGLPIQILLYPPLSARLGTLRSYRLFLWPSILVYAALPFLTLIAQSSSSSSSSSSGSTSALLWVALIAALGMQVLARAFVGPATVVLVNNCTPHPQLLATVHGLAQSISSAARMVGPLLGGAALAWAEERGCAGAPFWGMAGLAVVNWGVLWWVVEED